MKVLRQIILWCVLVALGLLAIFSIIGAFLGAENAKEFFNSCFLRVFWFVFLALLAVGFLFFRRLVTTPAGLAMHLGTMLVLLGAMWGSGQAHAVRNQLFVGERPADMAATPDHRLDLGSFGRTLGLVGDKVPLGYMLLHPNEADDLIMADDMVNPLGALPFYVALDDFRIEYYPVEGVPWGLLVQAEMTGPEGANRMHQSLIEWKLGQPVKVPFTKVQVTVLESYEHARPAPGGGAVSDPESAHPALKVLLEYEGRRREGWLVPASGDSEAQLQLGPIIKDVPDEGEVEGPSLYFVAPSGTDIKAYKSNVTIIENGQPAAEATIAVNHPLAWGGYHFYQYSYDRKQESYTVLSIVSNSGLWAVYLGLFLLVFGTFWRFWAEPAWRYLFAGGRHGD
jgi:hypothetical protein